MNVRNPSQKLLASVRRHLARFHSWNCVCWQKDEHNFTCRRTVTARWTLTTTDNLLKRTRPSLSPAFHTALRDFGKVTGRIVCSPPGSRMMVPLMAESSLTASRWGTMQPDETAQSLHRSIIKSASNSGGERLFVSTRSIKCSNLWEATHNIWTWRRFSPQQTYSDKHWDHQGGINKYVEEGNYWNILITKVCDHMSWQVLSNRVVNPLLAPVRAGSLGPQRSRTLGSVSKVNIFFNMVQKHNPVLSA